MGDPTEEKADAVEKTESAKPTTRKRKQLTPEEKAAAEKEAYANEMSRRFRCQVNSNRKGVQHFEMIVPDPRNTRRPISVKGHCGVIIEEGLTLYVIKQLESEHHLETLENKKRQKDLAGNTSEGFVTTHDRVPVYHYNVKVMDEIENPKPLGKAGKGRTK